ncbi:CehA/McbA family metallohydrolase [Phenylobacterium sp.]|uniref:CehA/McbA family metallohydrolase n=1 Tax=Phenylobacterium sp. TaxID=1871053 RepID=UPI0012082D65|nr:CehA/McbA family metallohydrolase [Phenylobacterium sp.]THD55405.1 MAG: phosphoesterase [Phenylobacterium sp.]
MKLFPGLLLALAVVLAPMMAAAQVRIVRGPTPILGGDARAAGDLTVVNEKLAFALAIESPPPYGVPRGALVDLAPVVDGKIGRDRVVFADFIPNNWSAWPNTYHRVEVVKDSPQEVVVRTERDWGEVAVSTVYALKSGEDQVRIAVTMTNGGRVALADLRSGLTLWPSSGHLFAVPGLGGVNDGPAAGALSDRVVAYDEDWFVALHAPYLEHVGYGSKDMYRTHTLAPGESRTFEGWLQVGARGDLAPVVAVEIARRRLPSGELEGQVTGRDGRPIPAPVVVIEKSGQPYAWTVGDAAGRYRMALPAGDYRAYATAKSYSETARTAAAIVAGATLVRDFGDLRPPGSLRVSVTDQASGAPLDARIAIEQGQKPVVEFLGRKVFFTELDAGGVVEVKLAPGDYVLSVAHGLNVLAPPVTVKAKVASGATESLAAPIRLLADPPSRGWYAADLHHHADQAEAVTPPADLARSQLAAGLDLLFVSDHDATVNHRVLQAIADRRGVPFIPSVEISTSWAHFNAYPVKLGEPLAIDTGATTIDAVIAEARRLGAEVLQVNHPLIPYGYFASLDRGVAPGGFNPGFDLIEINSDNRGDDDKVLARAWGFWNAGARHYLAAGSDTHDVWNQLSGAVRTYAHPDGPVTAISFARALKAGHAYVTYGPLIFPDRMFGETLRLKAGQTFDLGFDLKAATGLKSVSLIRQGAVAKSLDLAASGRETHVSFPLKADTRAWYALVVEDKAGGRAYTDPIWVEVAGAADWPST